MMGMRSRVLAAGFVFVAIGLVAQGCGEDNAIVGGSCASSYTACSAKCVDLSTDPSHCGACDTACAPGASCSAGVCNGMLDGSSGDGSNDGSTDGSSTDGSDDGSNTDGSNTDGSNTDGSLTDACPPPPYTSVSNCGACGVVCVSPNTTCRLDATNVFTCQPPCTPPLSDCNGVCVDLQNDPFNCGTCGKFCPSNVCSTALCQGATPGDIVVIGHDFQSGPPASSQAKLLSNAVFIPTSNPLRILSYEQFADAASVTQAKSVLTANASGRTLKYTVATTPAAIQAATLVANFDVILIYDQVNGTAAQLGPIATTAATPLNKFAKGGGVIVALDGASGQGAMPTFLTNAGLLDVPTHTSIAAGSLVRISAPGDKVGSLVIGPYGTFVRSATFKPNEPNGGNVVYVAQQLVGGVAMDPVVIHKVVP